MTTENELSSKPSPKKISRRTFLGLAGLSGITAALAKWGFDLPPLPEPTEAVSNKNEHQPGFAEMQMEPTHFISPRYGHIPYIKSLGQVPLIRQITGRVYEEMMTTFKDKAPKLGTALAIAGDKARDVLTVQYPKIEASALDEETLHLAAVSLGVLFSNRWKTFADLEKLMDVNLKSRYEDIDHFYWGEEGINRVIKPLVFGRFDRADHVSNHFFITTEYIYGKKHDLELVSSMPRGLKELINIKKEKYDQAKILSWLSSNAYELRTTVWPLENLKFWDRPSIEMGFLDLHVDADLKANLLGHSIAHKCQERLDQGETWPEIKSWLVETYDQDEWYQEKKVK